MKIDTNSWHYRIYKLSCQMSYESPWQNTNLCAYMRRVMLIAPLQGLAMAFIMMMYCVLVLPLATLVKLIIGYKPQFDLMQDSEKYSPLKIGKMRIYPWHIILPLIFAALNVYMIMNHHVIGMSIADAILAIIAAIIVFFFVKSNKTKIFKDWLRAKKENVCPIVSFDSK